MIPARPPGGNHIIRRGPTARNDWTARAGPRNLSPVKMSTLRPVWLAALLASGALLGVPPLAGAERKKDAPPEIPPPAQPLAVKVPRGETLPILLRIYGRKNEALKYLIRTPPQHGRLTAPQVVEREVSSVTYTPPADLALVRDRFTYAVQTAAGVSAAVDVVITIVDLPPAITVPEVLNFPSILAGTTTTRPLEITNHGGGFAEGRVTVDAPWKIEGAGNYRLAAGARAVFKVIFAPAEPGIFDTVMRFSSQPGTTLPIHAEAQASLSAAPAKILLQHAAGDPVRAGAFALTNHTATELRVALSSGARLTVPPELTVPAHGTVPVAVQTAGRDVAALEDEVRLQSAGLTLRVPVRAAAVGAIVRATRELVALGRVDAAQSADGQVGLENIGGTATRVSWEIAAPFASTTPPVTLAAGEKTTVTVRTQPAIAGKHRALLTVHADQQKLEIPVEAELLAASSPAAPRTPDAPFTPLPDSDPPPPPEPTDTAPVPDAFRGDLVSVPGVKVRDVTAKAATLEWPAAQTKAARFRLENRTVFIDPLGQLAARWEPLSTVTIRHEGESQIARITGLQPATTYRIRVVALGAESETGTPLFTRILSTHIQPSFWAKFTPLRILLLALALCVAFVLRQRRAARRRP